MSLPNKINHLAPLTSLRLFAASMIFIFHLKGFWGFPSGSMLPLWQGVTFFFVLSGFILTYSYADMYEHKRVARFLWSRFARLWPLHLATLFVAAAFLEPDTPARAKDTGTLILNALLLQSFVPEQKVISSFNSPAWTISNEVFFYLMLPILVALLRRIWLVFALLAMTLALAMWISGSLVESGSLSKTTVSLIFHFSPPVRLLEFVFGVCLAKIFHAHREIRFSPATASVLEALALALVAAGMLTIKDTGAVIQSIFGVEAGKWFRLSGLFPLFGLLILIFAYSRGMLSKILSWPLLVLGGEISFALYMIHQLAIRTFLKQSDTFTALDDKVVVGLLVLFVFALSYLAFRFIEDPFRRAIVKRKNFFSTLGSQWRTSLMRKGTWISFGLIALVPLFQIYSVNTGYREADSQWVAAIKRQATRGSKPSFGNGLVSVEAYRVSPCGKLDICVDIVWKVDAKSARLELQRHVFIIQPQGKLFHEKWLAHKLLMNENAPTSSTPMMIGDRLRISKKLLRKSPDGNIKIKLVRSGRGQLAKDTTDGPTESAWTLTLLRVENKHGRATP